jgi:hypothetical protein
MRICGLNRFGFLWLGDGMITLVLIFCFGSRDALPHSRGGKASPIGHVPPPRIARCRD